MGIMFSPDMMQLVLSGKKTQTRRRWRNEKTDTATRGISAVYDRPEYDASGGQGLAMISLNGFPRRKWRVGSEYAVQPGRGKKSVGRVKLTGIRLETFASISQDDAEAEGFTDPAAFHAKIKSLYGDDFDFNQPCWALTFSLVNNA